MRREYITSSIVAAIIVAVFGGTVLVLNATLYSAGGFVRSYLDSLARHDVDGALELAGTVASGDASDELLVAGAIGELSGIRVVCWRHIGGRRLSGLDGFCSRVWSVSTGSGGHRLRLVCHLVIVAV